MDGVLGQRVGCLRPSVVPVDVRCMVSARLIGL